VSFCTHSFRVFRGFNIGSGGSVSPPRRRGAARAASCACLRQGYNVRDMDSRLSALFSRRSVRKYSGEPVSEADVRALLEAGMAAPSASNRKPWHFVAVTERAQVIASNHGVEVEYQLPAAARVRATLHDAVGRQVGVLDIGLRHPGAHRLSWDQDRGGRKLASGAYFVLLDMGSEKSTLKAVIR
jgi:hypothetical protein